MKPQHQLPSGRMALYAATTLSAALLLGCGGGGSSTTPTTSTTAKLPHSGVTASQCYAAGSNTLVACSSAEAKALSAQQDGHRANTNPMAYSLVPKTGGGSYDKTECVKDNITGLIWEGKTSSGTRAGSNYYTNYDDTNSAQKPDGSKPSQADIDASTNSVGYKNAANAAALCGYTDWRLPTADELQTIVDYSVAAPGPTLNTTWFPNTPSGTVYWSSSPYVDYGDYAWYVDFSNGNVYYYSRNYTYAVRLVRASQ